MLFVAVSFFALSVNVKALETIQISNQQDYFNAIATINTSNETDFIISLAGDVLLDTAPSSKDAYAITNKNVTVLGNGHKFKISETGSYGYYGVITINNGILTLGKEDGSDSLTIEGGGENVNTSESLIFVNGTLNMYDGVVLTNQHGGVGGLTGSAIRLSTNSTFNMYGGTISDNTCDSSSVGGAVTADSDGVTINIENGTFKNNYSVGFGGAIVLMGTSTVDIKNATFENNKSNSYGGAIMLMGNSTVNINNSTFKKNNGKYGGALFLYDGTITAKSTLFEENSGSSGGAVLVYSGTYNSENNVYKKNEASYGGAIRSQGKLVSKNDDITENKGVIGAGIYIADDSYNFSESNIYNNKATRAANDVYLKSTVSQISLKDMSSSNKTATFDNKNVAIDGWYSDADDSRFSLDTPKTKVTSITAGTEYFLTAAGTSKVVVVKFSGEGVSTDDQMVVVGSKLAKPVEPTRDGYTFGGWYTSEDYATLFDFDNSVTEDTVLYAKWTKKSDNGIINPNTGDKILLYASIFGVSLLAIAGMVIYKKKTN